MRASLIVKCSMVIGAVLTLVACIDNGSLDSGDVRTSSEMLTMYALREQEQQTHEAEDEMYEDYLSDQATMAAKWEAQHPQG